MRKASPLFFIVLVCSLSFLVLADAFKVQADDSTNGSIVETKTFSSAENLRILLAQEPIKPIVRDNQLNIPKVLLGEMLFFDKRLSADNSLSCASCHRFELGGADAQQFATGINGQKGRTNSPTVFNSRYNIAQFWDGRAQTLELQALSPVENPLEMGAKWPDVVVKLSQDKLLVQNVKRIYNQPISAAIVTDAIAEYERSLVTLNAPFDQYLLGDSEAISNQAKQGYLLFKSYGCISCHQGISVGSNMFHQLGIMIAYFAPVDELLLKRDLGRFNVTQQDRDKYRFKVPSLRLVTQTAPYFHDGSVKTLHEAIKVMAKYQLLGDIPDVDVELIIEFLKTLTGKYERLSS
ncbi:MAG: cytochrome c peroxidase [Pseudomonadota bacterium]